VIEYGDNFDIMGGSSGHFGAFQKERLGWLNAGASPPITTVQASGTYSLDPYESSPGSNAKALKILKSTDPSTGAHTWYYVEYRRALGYDAFLAGNTNALDGVIVHLGTDADGNSSELLDMTPSVSGWSAPALDVWQSFYDSDAGVGISPVSATNTGATVSISIGAPPGPVPCVHATPSLTAWPASQTVPYGIAVNYSLSIANYDNSGCGPSSFALQAAVPTGWTASLSSSALTISPGGSASTTLQVTAPFFTAAGSYVVGATATNAAVPSFGASTTAAYIVGSSGSGATATATLASGATATATPVATATSVATATPRATATSTKPSAPTTTPSPGITLTFTPTATPSALTATPSAAFTATPTPGALTVVLASSQASYVRGQMVSITASVSSGGAPMGSAGVTFTVTKSNGAVVSQSATTGSNGVAIYQLRLKKQDPTGTYQVVASAKLNGAVGSSTTSFTVQ
jgi:hypothetical protein